MGFPALSEWVQPHVHLWAYSTLRAGGPAEWFAHVRSVDALSELSMSAHKAMMQTSVLGWGSNVLPSDDGVPGLVIHNACSDLEFDQSGEVVADAGCGLQELFLKTAQRSLSGLEFAVGIPGTLGGALVSNAGAYRSNISGLIKELEIVCEGKREWVSSDWMEFAYRDSKLRRHDAPQCTLLRVRMQLNAADAKSIYDTAREYQRQRISKQPAQASAGSFFKNVNDKALAISLRGLPDKLKDAGVVPAGYLLQQSGMAGFSHNGAMFARRHANFILNVGGAKATDIRTLADIAKQRVFDLVGVTLEEEVLYIGDWRSYVFG